MCKCVAIDRPYDEDGDVMFDKNKIQETLAIINANNQIDFIMDWEDGQLCPECTIAFFQYLINTGLAWSLQGMYGRMATDLIEAGYCTRRA
jgi:hypothetical protein